MTVMPMPKPAAYTRTRSCATTTGAHGWLPQCTVINEHEIAGLIGVAQKMNDYDITSTWRSKDGRL
jgi:hypothetical protein